MHQHDILSIVDAAHETADAIVGAREWRTPEDASDMRDVIFWDLLAKQLPDMTVAQIASELDRRLE
jgi:phosphoribosyl-ATP pyrophosphohydrolase